MKREKNIKPTSELRKKAEKLLSKKESKESYTEAGCLKLIHELEVHQIELELQNQELIQAKDRAELAEKKYSEHYDFSPLGYLSLLRSGDIIDLNLSAGRLLGKKRPNLMKNNFGFFVSLETRPIFNNFLQKIFSSKLEQTCEFELEIGDNPIKYILANGITSETGEKCLLTLTNITAHKQVERELIEAKEKAEENDRLKSAFLANVSHEIRTPMNGILGFTELLKTMKLSGKEKQDYLHIIQKSGNRMLNIINDIITISRIESEQLKVELTNANVNELLGEVCSFFKPEAEQKKIHLFISSELPENNPFIRTDSEKLYAVLTNLVKNAIKFTPSGSVELGCVAKGDFIEFYVKDSGPGIPDEQKSFIFERFRQGSELLTRDYEGSGLGLAISKAYVELLGGAIWVESDPDSHRNGHGSTFHFTVPDFFATEEKIQEQVVTVKEFNPNLKLKVLVVDDDETSRILLSLMLSGFESQIIHASTGLDAVKACRQHPDLDLVFMDIKMPGMDGYEATRQIREFNKAVIIIAQTAYALDGDREKAINAGCNNYISKPIKRAVLLDLITQHLN